MVIMRKFLLRLTIILDLLCDFGKEGFKQCHLLAGHFKHDVKILCNISIAMG